MEVSLLEKAREVLAGRLFTEKGSSLVRLYVDPTCWDEQSFNKFVEILANPAVYNPKPSYPYKDVYENFGPKCMSAAKNERKRFLDARYPPGYLLPLDHMYTRNIGKETYCPESRAWTASLKLFHDEQEADYYRQKKTGKK